MNFTPLGERVLVEKEEAQTQTASGIIIVDSAQEKPQTAIVKAIGDEVENLKVDDKVVLAKYSGTEITLDGKDFQIVEVSDILGILK